MSHSTVLVVLDGNIDEITLDLALADALEKFDENKETPVYIRKTKAQLIEEQRAEYIAYRDTGLYAKYLADPAAYREGRAKDNHDHLRYVSEEFPKKLDRLDDDAFIYEEATQWCRDELDDDGNLLSTYNPHSKWDWYTIGGRWTASVLNTTGTIEHEPDVWNKEGWTELTGGVDIVRKRDLTNRRSTFAFLDKAGEWHERGKMGWFGMASDEKDQQEWDDQLTALVDKVEADDWLILVDVHI